MATATATRTSKGFKVTCPKCNDTEAEVLINLNDLAECKCSGCDEYFSATEARDLVKAELARWEAVCRWVELGRELL